MMMVLCPKAGSLAFMSSGYEMSEVVSRCLPHRQLWVSNLSKGATQWLEVYSNLRLSGWKAQNILLHHRIPSYIVYRYLYSASNSVSQTVHFSSRKRVRLKTRERETRKGEQRD